MTTSTDAGGNWPDAAYRQLKAFNIRQIAYVPDAGHSRLIKQCEQDRGMITVPLTTEEEGVALLAGAWLGGQRGVLLMQSSGVGNCINMLSLTKTCRLPLLCLITMRGQWGEFNPWQLPMGQATETVLQTMGVTTFAVDDAAQVAETVTAAARTAFAGMAGAAVLISQRIIGAKTFGR